jgi:hypothetical protein
MVTRSEVAGRLLTAEYLLGARVPPPLKPAMRRSRDVVKGFWPPQLADWRLERTDRHPVTFSEKLRYRRAYDRRPLLTLFCDRVAVRDYVAERVGDERLTHLHGIWADARQVPWRELPRQYAVKASHGSGGLVLVTDTAAADASLPASARYVEWDRLFVRPENAVPERLEAIAAKWMTLNYHYGTGRLPEWGYRDVPPRIVVEELLLDHAGRIPADWKCFVFDGRVRFLTIETDRFGDHRQEIFYPDGSRAPWRWLYDAPDDPTPVPANFAELVRVASTLGRGSDFTRVDLYNVDGERIVFGEMTSYPAGGLQPFPEEWEHTIGAWWDLVR